MSIVSKCESIFEEVVERFDEVGHDDHQERISCSSHGKSPNFPVIHSLPKLSGGIFSVIGKYEAHGKKNADFELIFWGTE